jgi:hypothetical protein
MTQSTFCLIAIGVPMLIYAAVPVWLWWKWKK